DAGAEQPVEQIDQCDRLGVGGGRGGRRRQWRGAELSSSIAKEYGGHGPRASTTTSGCASVCPWTSATNSSERSRCTRYAALCTIVPSWPARRRACRRARRRAV